LPFSSVCNYNFPVIKSHLTYLRHKNGGGRVFDLSEICEKSYLCRRSEIREESSIWNSRIESSRIESSLVTNSVIKNSCVLASDITGGIIENSVISCELVTGNVRLKNCQIYEKSRIAHGAVCENVKFKNLTVKGSAVLKQWNQTESEIFDGHHGYVSRGVWERPPRVWRVSDTITVTESTAGFAFVHCRELPLEHWLKIGNRYGAACNWTSAEIKTVRKIMHLLQRT